MIVSHELQIHTTMKPHKQVVNLEENSHIRLLVHKHVLAMVRIEVLVNQIPHADVNQDMFTEKKIKQLNAIMFLNMTVFL